ncbi:hypothetical protein ABTZ58_19005 [Streptomyces sp. NPDC094143]|uniref:hypothetical protein n=1 Tax=Streptomyces sp. NPDC094143 TaxID=3155310 RepID=UPI0033291B45
MAARGGVDAAGIEWSGAGVRAHRALFGKAGRNVIDFERSESQFRHLMPGFRSASGWRVVSFHGNWSIATLQFVTPLDSHWAPSSRVLVVTLPGACAALSR